MKLAILLSLVYHICVLFYDPAVELAIIKKDKIAKIKKIIKKIESTKHKKKDKILIKKYLMEKITKIKKEDKEKGKYEKFNGFIPKKIKVKFQVTEGKLRVTKCIDKDSYFGIGVLLNANNNSKRSFWEVTDVAPGYSADRSGICPGDILLGSFDGSVFHEGSHFIKNNPKYKNKYIKILIQRKGQLLNKSLLVEKVCLKSIRDI